MRGLALRDRAGEDRGGYRGGRSPVGLGGAIAVHGAALAVFLLMPREMMPQLNPWKPFVATNVPIDPPPPENPPEQKVETRTPTRPPDVTRTETIVDLPADPAAGIDRPVTPPVGGASGSGTLFVPPPPLPPPPMLVEPSIDPRALAAFQPDYPPMMIRMSKEGSVTVRVQIGTDGRVTAVALVSATDEAFWTATQRHALRKWRFRPATRDGVAVPGAKVLTVHFRLENR